MKNPTLCPRCGVQLPTSAEAGAPCPRCLMQLGFEESSPKSPQFEEPNLQEVIDTFPQLEILEHVGTGGMGIVYHARQKGLDRDVALKLVSVDVTADPAFAERFTREARALASLAHPAITSVYDFGQVGRFYYLIMEYVDGANLRQILNTGGLSPREAMAMVSRMCDALQYAHDHGIVHRDIKPENLLVDRKGQLKIIDFGLAKILGQAPTIGGLTRTDQAMGTWHYMAPEQVERPLQVDHRADIFSLGVVFYELLTGELPLGRFSPPSERGEMDVRLDKIVMRALEKEPDARYQRAGQVKTDLDVVSTTRGGPQLAAAHESGPHRGRRRAKHNPWAIIGGCLGIMFLMGCLGVVALMLFSVNPATIQRSLGTTGDAAPVIYSTDEGSPRLEVLPDGAATDVVEPPTELDGGASVEPGFAGGAVDATKAGPGTQEQYERDLLREAESEADGEPESPPEDLLQDEDAPEESHEPGVKSPGDAAGGAVQDAIKTAEEPAGAAESASVGDR